MSNENKWAELVEEIETGSPFDVIAMHDMVMQQIQKVAQEASKIQSEMYLCEMIEVQPMTAPSSLLFYLDYRYKEPEIEPIGMKDMIVR